MQKFLQYLFSEDVACSSRGYHESRLALFRITPHHIAQRTIVRNLLKSVEALYLIHRFYQRRQSPMHSEDVAVHYCCNREEVEEISEQLPHYRVAVFVLALHIEAIVLSDCSQFVITSDQQHFGWVFEFQEAEKGDGLYAMCTSIDIVSQKEIVGVGQFPSDLEYFEYIEELSMNIANNCNWQCEFLHVFLLNENILELVTQNLNSLLLEHFALQHSLQQTLNLEPHPLPTQIQIQTQHSHNKQQSCSQNTKEYAIWHDCFKARKAFCRTQNTFLQISNPNQIAYDSKYLLIDFKAMSSDQQHEVIQIQDEGEKDYSSTKNTQSTHSDFSKLFKTSAFPRLSSILKKHVERQTKTAKDEQKIEEELPKAMPHSVDIDQVSHIIKCVPVNQDPDQTDNIQSYKHNQQQNRHFHQETDLTINQDNQSILMIEEDAQPLVRLYQQTSSKSAEFQSSAAVSLPKQRQQIAQTHSQLPDQQQQINTVNQTQKQYKLNINQSQKQYREQLNKINLQKSNAQHVQIQEISQDVQKYTKPIQQTNNIQVQNNPQNQLPIIHNQLDDNNNLQQSQRQSNHLASQNILKIKMKIIDFLPELSTTLNYINDEQVFSIYKSIQQKINHKTSQTFIQPINTHQKQFTTQHIESSNQRLESLASLSIQDQQTVSYDANPANRSNLTSQVSQPIHSLNQQVDSARNILQEALSISFDNKEQKFRQNHVQSTREQSKIDTVSSDTNKNKDFAFSQLKNLSIDELREKMIQYFPDNKEELALMNHDQLKGILNQAIQQFQRQTRQTKITEQPTSKPLNQVSQKQTVPINTLNQECKGPPIIMPSQQQSPSLNSKSKDQIDVDQVEEETSLAEMKKELLNLLPNMRNEIQCMIDERDIRQLYHQAKKNNLITPQSKKQPNPKKITRPLNPKSLSYHQILKICLEKFPNLKDQIQKLNEQQIRKIYQQIQNKIASNSKTYSQKISNADLTVQSEQPPTQRQSPSLKRTHDMMIAASKQPIAQDRNGAKKKPKVNVSDIRLKLVTKFPHLRQRIMQIDDLEIQKIYFQSINTNPAPPAQTKSIVIEQKPKSTQLQRQIIQPQVSIVCSKETAVSQKGTVSQYRQGNTQIYDISNPQKSKNSRTIVLVHTEELNGQEEGDSMYKVFKTQKGLQKKCVCECCKTTDVTELLKRLVLSLSKK